MLHANTKKGVTRFTKQIPLAYGACFCDSKEEQRFYASVRLRRVGLLAPFG